MLRIYSQQRPIFVLIFLLIAWTNVFCFDGFYSAPERYSASPLTGNKIRKDSSSTVTDTAYWNSCLTAYYVRNLITFKIDEASNLKLPDTFNISIKFKVFYYRDASCSHVYDSTSEIQLAIGYNKNNYYDTKAIYTFTGGYRATLKLTDVTVSYGVLTDFQNSIMVENEILIRREYAFSCTNNAVDTLNRDTSQISSKGELIVSWSPERPADEFDLEWTYIDSAAKSNYYKDGDTINFDPKKIFTNNSSRVSIPKEMYNIPLLYDNKGILFFRVRTVQIKLNGQRLESLWSSDFAQGLGRYDYNGHERLLNWQATTSFAEDGKRKSVVQYFDGSLRSRQAVTKDNITDTTIVAETFYDNQGRPVIQVLPTPSLSKLIKYTPNFNTYNGGVEYEKDRYDSTWSDSCYCLLGAPRMDSATGASKYYSANNPDKDKRFHKYIPAAKGYPFTETRYTPDNSGRISIQGGVGLDFQIGKKDSLNNTHETKYFYGSADQEELDGLFGTEAGKASHYFKNMVRDANGQYSVSYVDMHGRTIATALAGKPTSKLDTLVSNISRTITKKLLDSNNNIVKGITIESSKSLIVTRADSVEFIYSLMPDSISIKDCQNVNVCYDCVYDLEIILTDECNNATLPDGVPYKIADTSKYQYPQDIACNQNTAMPAVDKKVFLREGNYLVTKRLTINKKAMDYYRDSVFVIRNTCKTVDTFIQQQKNLLYQQIQCETSCQSCMDSLGTWTNFRAKYMQQLGIDNADSAAYRDQALLSYNNMKAQCDALCDSVGLHNDIRRQMLVDVTPPFGQYANPDAIDELSVFRKLGLIIFERRMYSWIEKYMDENGKPDTVFFADGSWKLPRNLNINEFVQQFKPSWADSLLILHPEYWRLRKYDSLKASHIWDEKFSRTETFKAAKDSGYFNPANFSGLPATSTFTYYSQRADPLFTTLAPSYKSEMQDSLKRKIINISPADTISAWSLATLMAHCKIDDNTCFNIYKKLDTNTFKIDTACSGELDIAWRYFREMYLQEKREILYKILIQAYPYLPEIDSKKYFINFPDPNQKPSDMPKDTTVGKDSLSRFIDSSCYNYATQWWEELKPCNFNLSGDSARIVSRLVKICQEGGDAGHPFGASSVKPSSTYTFRSFDQFLKFYCDSAGITPNYDATCNVYLITAPKPYDQQPVYFNKPVFSKPDSCECNKINSYYVQYQAYGQSDSNFAAFIYRTTGVRIYNGALDTLRMACNGQINCNFLNQPLELPTILQCGVENACVPCVVVDTLYKGFKQKFPGIAPSYSDNDSLQRAYNQLFERYMNNNLGFSKTAPEYLRFMDSCGIPIDTIIYQAPSDTSSVTCTQLKALGDIYYYQYINPGNRLVALDMRTFAGNKTPSEGPKGVFDVSGNLIGNTISGTADQINDSYTSIWNSSAINNVVGYLSYQGSGKFQLRLNAGQKAPCNGIVGMRYYKFDCRTKDTLYGFGTTGGSYIDFGDSSRLKVEFAYSDSKTTVSRATTTNGYIENMKMLPLTYPVTVRLWLSHYYTHTSQAVTYTVTVYHTDMKGTISFDDPGPYTDTAHLKNLRGYFPQELLELFFSGTRDSSINRTDSIYNFSQITSIKQVQLLPSSANSSPYLKNNLGSFANNHNLMRVWITPRYQIISDTSQLNSLAGKQFSLNFPNMPSNFPQMRQLFLQQWGARYPKLTDFKYELPNLKYLEISVESMDSTQIDSVLIQLARVNTVYNGVLYYSNASPAGTLLPPTNASSSARTTLNNRGWALYGISTSTLPGMDSTKFSMNDTLPLTNQFTDFLNLQFNTQMDWAAVKALYRKKCGYMPDLLCNPAPSAGPILCGKIEPVFPPVPLTQYSPCDDSTNFATWKGTLLYESYRDSLKGSFEDKYLDKCLKARYNESFTAVQKINEYHYTLYYYDQAGNLVKTVPPEGVDLSRFGWLTTWMDSVKTSRNSGQLLTPVHKLQTRYRYNTLNQVVAQNSPDGGTTEFWFDRLGRISISRNAKQKAAGSASDSNMLYSYTRYDYLGRITEVGQVRNTIANGNMTDAISRSAGSLNTWLNNLTNRRGQITQTVYDLPYTGFAGIADTRLIVQQRNLRNRVSYVMLFDTGTTGAHNQATYYTYDIHGNVDTLLQDYGCGSCGVSSVYNMMNRNGLGNRFKKTTYKYDLISGKVNMVLYQKGWIDQFIHRYSYDAENRLTLVETSADSLVWQKDARYEYYKHGPLARMVMGDQLVQGVDYAYTLQGWLKGINSTSMNADYDMGNDGKRDSLNQYTARDVYGLSLNYFAGDYEPIKNTAIAFPAYRNSLGAAYKPLYNGNISSMTVNIGKLNTIGSYPMFYNYSYDQLNRITGLDSYTGLNETTNTWTLSAVGSYKERVVYDANGNIQKYLRNDAANSRRDSLTYYYYAGTNKLRRVKDSAGQWLYTGDLDNQLKDSNYIYDEIGNLIIDTSENIFPSVGGIKWNVYGKITEINRSAATTLTNVKKINYYYDAQGNRIGKTVEKFGTSVKDYTWYVRDAQGNILNVYSASGNVSDPKDLYISLVERYLYGSSRLGVDQWSIPTDSDTTLYDMAWFTTGTYKRGWRQYELSNHLGNVLVSITDRKYGVPLGGGSSLIDYYTADVVNAQDYYPFGFRMPGRGYNNGPVYRFGFNGRENDRDAKGDGNQYDYGFRIYDPRLGRFLSVDPLFKGYPWYTPYQFAGNMPIWAIDLDGLEEMKANSVAHVIKDLNGNIITIPTIVRLSNPYVYNIPGVKRLDDNYVEVTPGLIGQKHDYFNTFTWQQVNGKDFYINQSITPIGQDAGGTIKPPKTNLQQDNDDVPPPAGRTPVITPINIVDVNNQTLTRNINFVSGEPQFATDADRQMVNQVAGTAPNSSSVGKPVTTTNGNTTTTTRTTRQVRSIITINLRTDLEEHDYSRNLQTNRYNLIRQQLINSGVPSRNIRRGTTQYGQSHDSMGGNTNQTIFRVRTTRSTRTTGTSTTTE